MQCPEAREPTSSPGGRVITRYRRRWVYLGAAALVLVGATGLGAALRWESPDHGPVRTQASGEPPELAFSADSWWNTPLPRDPPQEPGAGQILNYLRSAPESGPGCLMLAGAGNSPWGQPIYTARPSDPEYDVHVTVPGAPPELGSLRIPVGAEAASNNDGSMTVYDRQKGYVVMLTNAEYDGSDDSWTAGGASVSYLASNGLDVRTGRSDDPRNRGTHRGNNGATAAVSWDEVRGGEIRHVVKVAAGPELSDRYVFPMVGSDGDYTGSRTAVPPQGLRFRIRPSVDLDKLHLEPEALVIAEALQRFGFYLGDSGGRTALKLENTVAEGRGRQWKLPADALCALPFDRSYWQVVEGGYDPSGESGAGLSS